VPLPTGDDQQRPVSFGDTFPLAVEMTKLVSKTLQVTIWTSAVPDAGVMEECLGAAQVSLADFDIETVSVK
jgi:protein KIBRA